MDKNSPYTRRDFIYAVNCSAITAWGIVELVISLGIGFSELPWNAFIGLPVAFVAVWIFGAPFIYKAMADSISFPRAMLLGLSITSICAFAYVIFGRITDLLTGANKWEVLANDAQGRRLTVDGYLTTVGAQQVLTDVVIYLCAGVLIGTVVRTIVGPGQEVEADARAA